VDGQRISANANDLAAVLSRLGKQPVAAAVWWKRFDAIAYDGRETSPVGAWTSNPAEGVHDVFGEFYSQLSGTYLYLGSC
jgi:hypothetical protein